MAGKRLKASEGNNKIEKIIQIHHAAQSDLDTAQSLAQNATAWPIVLYIKRLIRFIMSIMMHNKFTLKLE